MDEIIYWVVLGLIYLLVKRLRKGRQQPQRRTGREVHPRAEEVQEEEETLPSWLETFIRGEEKEELQPEPPERKKRQATLREDLAAFDEALAEPVMETEFPVEVIPEPQVRLSDIFARGRSKAPAGGVQKGRMQRALDMHEIREVVASRKKLRQLIIYREILGPPIALRFLRIRRQF